MVITSIAEILEELKKERERFEKSWLKCSIILGDAKVPIPLTRKNE